MNLTFKNPMMNFVSFVLIIILTSILVYFIFAKDNTKRSLSSIDGVNSELFFDKVNFDKNNQYALVIKGLTPEPVVVTDINELIKNKNTVQSLSSWTSFLPGEGGYKNGLYLFENQKLIKRVNHRATKVFQVGDLLKYAQKSKMNVLDLPATVYLDKIQQLNNSPKSYTIDDATKDKEFDPKKDYTLSITTPSIIICGNGFDISTHEQKLVQSLDKWIKKNINSSDLTYTYSKSSEHQNPAIVSNINGKMIHLPEIDDILKAGQDVYIYSFYFHARSNQQTLLKFKDFKFPEFEIINMQGCNLNNRVQELLARHNLKHNPKDYVLDPFQIRTEYKFPKPQEYTYRLTYVEMEN